MVRIAGSEFMISIFDVPNQVFIDDLWRISLLHYFERFDPFGMI